VAGATRLIVGEGWVSLEGGIRFSGEVIIATGAFVLGQVPNFGSMAYIANHSGELHPLKETTSVNNTSSALYPKLDPLGADLKVLAWQIRFGLDPKPTVSERHQMFYMPTNVHYQIATREVLSSPDHFWYFLLDLPYGIQNATSSVQLKLEHLIS
jgi:hypothetical protein